MLSRFRVLMLFAALAAVFLLTTGCGPKETKLTAADSGKTITLNAGETLVIQLEGNPSTGYTWESKDLDTAMLQQIGETKFESSNPGLVGAGGTLTLTFKALQPGSTTLTLVYHRAWESVPPEETFTVNVTVK